MSHRHLLKVQLSPSPPTSSYLSPDKTVLDFIKNCRVVSHIFLSDSLKAVGCFEVDKVATYAAIDFILFFITGAGIH